MAQTVPQANLVFSIVERRGGEGNTGPNLIELIPSELIEKILIGALTYRTRWSVGNKVRSND